MGKLCCETVVVEDRPDGEHARLFDFRSAITELATDEHRRRQCALVLSELVSGGRINNSSTPELRRVPKAIQALLHNAIEGAFESADELAREIAVHPAPKPTIPVARLIR